jgi:hypothetical protein
MFSLERSWKSFTKLNEEKYKAFFELEIFRFLVVKSQGLDSNADLLDSPKSLDLDPDPEPQPQYRFFVHCTLPSRHCIVHTLHSSFLYLAYKACGCYVSAFYGIKFM